MSMSVAHGDPGSSNLNDIPKSRIATILKQLSEEVVVWSLICPTADRSHKNDGSSATPSINMQRLFLDEFCWLGDYDKGGSSVTSIAIHHHHGTLRYLMTTNEGPTPVVLEHLRWVMTQLEAACTASEDESRQAENQIVLKAVKFSSERVKNYKRWLCNNIKSAYEESEPPASTTSTLDSGTRMKAIKAASLIAKSLKALQASANPEALCDLAYDFRNTEAMRHLNFLSQHLPSPPYWTRIRHNIGRLGSWRKAAKTLVATARVLPQLVQGVELVPLYVSTIGASLGQPHVLQDDLRPMLPDINLRLSEEQMTILRQVRNSDETSEIEEKLSAEIEKRLHSCSTSRIHAECAVAEYFYQHDLVFFEQDRYVGCSKPSCYCCGLYFKHHPGDFVARPEHGNVWVQWLPPVGITTVSADQAKRAATTVDRILQAVRHDVRTRLLWKHGWRGRTPDSATNITSRTAASRPSGPSAGFSRQSTL